MTTPPPLQYPLPRQLKRPSFTFFYIFTALYALAVAISAIVALFSGSTEIMALTACIGAGLWCGFGIAALFSWQTVTVFDDYLLFNSFGKTTRVAYMDVKEAMVISSEDLEYISRTAFLTLYLHHKGEGKTPLAINLRLLGAHERVFLLQMLKRGAPNALFNERAEKVRLGRR